MSSWIDKVEQAAQFVKKNGKTAPKKKAARPAPNVGQVIENVAQTVKKAGKTTTPKQDKRNRKVLAKDDAARVERTNAQVEYALKEAVKKIRPKDPDILETLNPAKLSPAIDYLIHTPEGKKITADAVNLSGKVTGNLMKGLGSAAKSGRADSNSPLASVQPPKSVDLNKHVGNYLEGGGSAIEEDGFRVAKKTIKAIPGDVNATFAAIPQMAMDTIKHGPIVEAKNQFNLGKKDIQRRYGSSAKDTKKRFLEEGASHDAEDFASLLIPAGAGAGRAINKGIRSINPNAKLVRPRPNKVVEGVVHAQTRSPNAFTNIVENVVDRTRKAKANRVSGKGTDHKGNRKPATVSGIVVAKRGDAVIPIFEGHAGRKLNAQVIKKITREKSAAQIRKTDETKDIYTKPGKRLARYNQSEFDKNATALLGAYGVRSFDQLNSPVTKQSLIDLRDSITAKHAKGEVNRDINLETLDTLIDAPETLGKDAFDFMDSLEASNAKTRKGIGADVTNEIRKWVPMGHALGLGDIRATFKSTLDKLSETRYKGGEVPSEVKQRLGEMLIDDVRKRGTKKGFAEPIYVSGKKHNITTNGKRGAAGSVKSETKADLEDVSSLNFLPSIDNTVKQTLNNLDKKAARAVEERVKEEFSIPELDLPESELANTLHNWGVSDKEAAKYIDSGGIPPSIHRELDAMGEVPARWQHAFDLAMRATSRQILGTNPAWVIFQAVAAATGAAMTRTGPLSIWRSTRWYKKLRREDQIKVDSFVGEGSLSDFTAARGKDLSSEWKAVPGFQHIHDSWNDYKGTPFYAVGKWSNPLRWTIEGNAKMETIIRRGIFYKGIKRQHWNNLIEGQGLISGGIDRFMNGMEDLRRTKDGNAVVTKYLDNEKFLEDVANNMDEWVGNYTAFSAMERKIFKRYTPFYGFLRYSLKFVLYTMPIKHPIVTSIMLKLGQLNAEEQNELFGKRDVPAYERAQLLWQVDQANGKKGVAGINIGRANPAGNAFMNLIPDPKSNFDDNAMRVFSLLPPYLSNAVGMVTGKDPFRGKPNAYNGAPGGGGGNGNPGVDDLLKGYIERTFLEPVAPYSAVKKYLLPGRQSTESSLLFGGVPTKLAPGEKAWRENRRQIKRDTDKGLSGNIAERLFGFPKVLDDVTVHNKKPKEPSASESQPKTMDELFGTDTKPAKAKPKTKKAKPDKKKIAAVISKAVPSPPKTSKPTVSLSSPKKQPVQTAQAAPQDTSSSGSDTGTAVTINADEPTTGKDVATVGARTASIPTTVSVKTPKLNSKQKANVAKALSVVDKKFPNATEAEKATMLSVMSVEQNFNNDPSGDRDSEGAFQQRPSQGWGTREQVNDLEHSVPKFMNKLIALRGSGLSDGEKAQKVQGSAFPERYAQHMKLAKSVLASATGKSPSSSLDPAITKVIKDATTTSGPLSDEPKTKTDDVGAVIAAVGSRSKKPLSKKILDNLTSGEFTTQVAAAEPAKGKQLLKDKDISGLATSAANGPTGKVSVAGNANRAGVGLSKLQMKTLAGIAGLLPGGVNVGTGTNHNRMTTSGNVSDHWGGNAADLPASGAQGDKIAAAALIYAGVSPNKARAMAKKGGLYNVAKNGVRYQIIWKTNIGGNHYDHVHVGARPNG